MVSHPTVSRQLSRNDMAKLKKAKYKDFLEHISELSHSDRAHLGGLCLLFSYPVLDQNELESTELPVSQRILFAVAKHAGCETDWELVTVGTRETRTFGTVGFKPDYVIIHPMISVLPSLDSLVDNYKKRFPLTTIVLQNSDQHQHEKVIGGPRAIEIAQELLINFQQVDYILLGFAEHALLSLLLDKPTTEVMGREGRGELPGRIYSFATLPNGDALQSAEVTGNSLRVQRARGCLAPCTYCIEGQANRVIDGERPWDGLPMDEFVERLGSYAHQGYFFINIIDSSFEDPGPRGLKDLSRFCELILQEKINLSFKIHLRAENALKADENALALWKKAGIDVIVCGLESGNQKELDFYRKLASKEISLRAFQHLERPEVFCNILGFMMFTPIATEEILREKVEFLREIGRGWDFLNLTNRLLVFWGTQIHGQLIDKGLIDSARTEIGYVPYGYIDARVETLDKIFNRIKKLRPGFMRLNNLIYDAMNLESRMLNAVNSQYLEMAGRSFVQFRRELSDRKSRLNDLYFRGFRSILEDNNRPFLPDFDENREYDVQRKEIQECLQFEEKLPSPPTTLYLQTWLSVVNRLGTEDEKT